MFNAGMDFFAGPLYNGDMNANECPTLRAAVCAALPCAPGDPRHMSPLNLAYIGDTVYDLYVRTRLIALSDAGVHKLHLLSAAAVCAKGQAAAYHAIADRLTEAEQEIYRRGRNAHMGTVPKNASIADYRTATGFEALLGYLYLSGEDARLTELLRPLLAEPEAPEKED